MEVLADIRPHSNTFLFSLQDKRRRYGMLQSQESGSSVFYPSQDKELGPDSGDCTKSMGASFSLGQAKDARLLSGDSTTNHGWSSELLVLLPFARKPW
jgi:hypothetical protein